MSFVNVIIILLVGVSASAFDPKITWKQIATEHFLIVHDSRQQATAQLFAKYAELAWKTNSRYFSGAPDRTVVVINDGTDLPNGAASGFPYPIIFLNPAFPAITDTISDLDSWYEQLVTHEYTHIMNLEPSRGAFRVLRWLFGSIMKPNMLLPRWYLEGLAVEIESRAFSSGRLRSPSFTAITRAHVLEDRLIDEDLSRVNETSIPDFPGGARPYLFGAQIWNQLARDYGISTFENLNQRYAGRMPFFINGPSRDLTGIGLPEYWDKTVQGLEKKTKLQMSALSAAGGKLTTLPASPKFRIAGTKIIPQKGHFSFSPEISPDSSKLLFIERDHNSDGRIVIIERPNTRTSFSQGNRTAEIEASNCQRAQFSKDGQMLIFDRTEAIDRYYLRYDLAAYHLESKRSRALTNSVRAREPTVSPDGRWIVFVQLNETGTSISAIPFPTDPFHPDFKPANPEEVVSLYTPAPETRLSRPIFINSNEIVFSEKLNGKKDGLFRLGIEDSGKGLKAVRLPSRIYSPGPSEATNQPAPFKSGEIIFVSDRNGIANAYSLSLSGGQKISPLTNVSTSIVTPTFDPSTGEIIYSILRSTRYQLIAQTPQGIPDQLGTIPAYHSDEDFKDSPPQLPSTTSEDRAPRAISSETATSSAVSEDYRSLSYLLPRYWFPLFAFAQEGYFVSANTSAADPVQRHAYSLSAQWDSLTSQAGGFATYVNQTTPLRWFLNGASYPEYLVSSTVLRRTSYGDLGFSSFIPGFSNDWSLGLALQYITTQFSGSAFNRSGVRAAMGYNSASFRGHEISPEKGGSFSLAYTRYLPSLSNIEYDISTLKAGLFLSNRSRLRIPFLPDRHVFALIANIAYAPSLRPLGLATSTTSVVSDQALSSSIGMRGYPSGAFLGRSLYQATVEYRFPLVRAYKGVGTLPFFLRRISGSFFADVVTLDGIFSNTANGTFDLTTIGIPFTSSGLLATFDTTSFYHVPLKFVAGLVYGFDRRINTSGPSPYFALQFTSLFPGAQAQP